MARLILTCSLLCNAFRQFALQTGSATEIRNKDEEVACVAPRTAGFFSKKVQPDFQAGFAAEDLSIFGENVI